MEKFTTLTAVAAPLPIDNVDTDKIIPARYLKTIKRTGLAAGLFADFRKAGDGKGGPFVLDQPAYKNAKILVVGDNFGCGSSREHAAWALLDGGIRCIIGESFSDIFSSNAGKNGILLIQLPPEEIAKLLDDASRGANATLTVDLEAQTIQGPDGGTLHFEVDPWKKHCLLNGLDDIGLTLQKGGEIDSFEAGQRAGQPWLYG